MKKYGDTDVQRNLSKLTIALIARHHARKCHCVVNTKGEIIEFGIEIKLMFFLKILLIKYIYTDFIKYIYTLYVYTHTYTRATRTHTHTHTRTHARTHARTRTRTRTQNSIYSHLSITY